jgi:pyruvate dehydrogenase E2 component (dihydrolipoyllysine-residue acetyltransferase)
VATQQPTQPPRETQPAPAEASKPSAATTQQPTQPPRETQPAPAEASKPSAAATQQPTQPPREAATPAPPPQALASEGNGSQGAPAESQAPTGRLIVSPLAARMAAEAGIDLRSLHGSGPGGRIIKRDIEAAVTQPKGAPGVTTTPAPLTFPRAVEGKSFQQPAIGAASPYRDEPLSEIRRTIARRLVTSLGPVPHFFLTTEIEMDRAAEMRRGINSLDPELKISINDIVIKVAAAALIQHPAVNASFQEKVIRYYERADIGVAVAIEEGLITPVIRSADGKSLSEIAQEVRALAEKARSRKLRPEEYSGASFSISNLGMFGIDEFTAVINPPEGGILAVGAMTPKPVVRENEIVIRQVMRVTMSCDHRVIDGATGAKFLQTFKKILENPLYLVV